MLVMIGVSDQGSDVVHRRPLFWVRKTQTLFNGLNGVWFQLLKRVHYDPTRFRKVGAEIQHVPVSRVFPIQHRFRHQPRAQRRVPRDPQLHLEVLQWLLRLVVDGGEVGVECENGGAGGEEVVDGESHGGGCVHGGGAEEVDDEGLDGGGLGDEGECGGDVGGIVADELEGPCG